MNISLGCPAEIPLQPNLPESYQSKPRTPGSLPEIDEPLVLLPYGEQRLACTFAASRQISEKELNQLNALSFPETSAR